MTKLEKFFTKKRLIILIVLFVITNLSFHFGPWSTSALAKVSGGMGIPDIMLAYDIETLRNMFEAYGPEGIIIYKNLQLIDFIYPIIYAAVLLGLLVRLKMNNTFKVLYATPFFIVFIDYSENFLLRHLINIYPNITEAQSHLVKLASLLTGLKWANIGALIFAILAYWIWKQFHKNNA